MGTHQIYKPLRLPGYDYSSPGAYFVTASTRDREFLFTTPEAKQAVESAWHSLRDTFANIELDEFVVMVNHIHGLIWILGEGAYRLHPGTWKNDLICRGGQLPAAMDHAKFVTLSNIIGAFKTTAATRINKLRGTPGCPVWQKSFYDHIVRNDREMAYIQEYIRNNPIKWDEDRDNPAGPQNPKRDYWDEIFS